MSQAISRNSGAVVAAGIAMLLVVSNCETALAQHRPNPSTLADSVLSLGARFEDGWNDLLCRELRATLDGRRESGALRDAESRIAKGEPGRLGSTIAPDALRLRKRWSTHEYESRLAAAAAESVAIRSRTTRPALADSAYREALAHYRRLGDRRRVAWVLGGLGIAARSAGDLAAADSLNRLALAARRELGDDRMTGNSLSDLGVIASLRGRHEESRGYHEAARQVREQAQLAGPLATTLLNLGRELVAMHRPDSATAYFRESAKVASGAADSTRTLAALADLGAALVDAGEHFEALAVLERASRIDAPGAVLAGKLEFDRGRAAMALGSYATAVRRLSRAVEDFRELGEPRRLASGLVVLGGAWIRAGEPVRALPALGEADSIAAAHGFEDLRARALNNRAVAAHKQQRWREADSLAARSLELAVDAGDSIAVHDAASTRGAIAFDIGSLAVAEAWRTRALECSEAGGGDSELEDRVNRAAVWIRQGRLEEADRELLAVFTAAAERNSPELATLALVNRADIAERSGRGSAAVALGRRALTFADTLRARQGSERTAIRVFAGHVDAFDALIHLLGRLAPQYPDSGFDAEAFLWAERSRARSLLDRAIEDAAPGLRAEPLAIADVQRGLRSDEALLEYSVGDSSSSLWVLRSGRWARYRLPAWPQLRGPIETLRRGLETRAGASAQTTRREAERLYRWLLAPAQPLLDGVTSLRIVPDGALCQIPFEALVLPAAKGGPVPHYLVERFAICYQPSAAFIARPEGRACSNRVMALGDPRFALVDVAGAPAIAGRGLDSGDRGGLVLQPLPFSAREVDALTDLAGAARVRRLTGPDATRAALLDSVLLASSCVIHLATHGQSDESEPERCLLWLAPEPGESEPGRFTLADIAGLRLCGGHVTLAACQSGLGRLERGEGIVGLARGFLGAGSGSVLASLWNVNDRATAALMARFYSGVLVRGESRAQALAAAKRELISSPGADSPYYWAAFQLIGDPSPLPAPR